MSNGKKIPPAAPDPNETHEINNFNMNMDEYLSFGNVVTPKQFLDKIAEIDVEKL